MAHNVSNQNIYIQSAALNGQPLNRPWITHEEIVKRGTLEFEMGILPNKDWGHCHAGNLGRNSRRQQHHGYD
jgi:putative alpha-1,2-mannosidase